MASGWSVWRVLGVCKWAAACAVMTVVAFAAQAQSSRVYYCESSRGSYTSSQPCPSSAASNTGSTRLTVVGSSDAGPSPSRY
jgi:hypothetical protein